MNISETLRLAFRSVKVNKMRSFLTALGIIIGVSAVITLVAIGQGASSSITDQIQGLGSNLLIVTPGQASQGGVRMGAGTLNTLTPEDVNAIAKVRTVSAVAPSVTKQAQLVYRNQNMAASVEGTSADYPRVRTIDLQAGRFFNKYEAQGQANVAIVGANVVENLFGDHSANVIGQKIEIKQIPFTIVGVLASQGGAGMTNNDDKVFVPVTTAMNRLFGLTKVNTIYVSAQSTDAIDQAQADVTSTLRIQHNLSAKEDNDFSITSQAQILNTAQGITGIMTSLLAGIAAISLIVGGIGIMNIMLVSVTERTREIGIRKAIGATRGVILRQFLIESIVLSLAGGIIGILIGVGGSQLIGSITALTTKVTLTPVLFSFFFSMLVGVVFGVYPARKAASLNPIDALRYE
ncbi:FtsX-like permease family protein [Heliobacterium gestii]|uniref:FtsX-like permease family protein n=1 Tax=Heliomicrobium gestii TaxID=2699 RepID=A0A845LDU0_HELGE|nr:ABC transporter permease [Heliomicrobium gestii]MBM7867457.1 putative ABC transport system permease protein [Heliomicrobium gestii]MZP43721.1 FtsX-like permease family protein [Heliomicrobium gestii]